MESKDTLQQQVCALLRLHSQMTKSNVLYCQTFMKDCMQGDVHIARLHLLDISHPLRNTPEEDEDQNEKNDLHNR